MTDSTTLTAWVNDYLHAWDSNEPDDIRAMFTEDAEYRTAPFHAPRIGLDAIVAGWLEDRDEPGDHEFEWTELGIDGDVAFVEGETRYTSGRRHANLWVIRFAPDGRATSFTEWYMEHPESERDD